MRTWVVPLFAACSAPAIPEPSSPPTNQSPPPRSVPDREVPPPTLANAGAKTCRLGTALLLGPHGESRGVLGFDSRSGIVAYKPEKGTLALQALRPDGTKLGSETRVPLAEGIEPKHVFALGGRFVVLARKWDYTVKDLNWLAVAVDASGAVAVPPAEVGLADADLMASRVLDDRRIALIVGAGYISKAPKQSPRWVTLTVDATGAISPASTPIDLRGLEGTWQEAELAGVRGWVIDKAGVRLAEGVFDGRRVPAAGATVRVPPADAITFDVRNGATPPPPGPGGRIIEAMGRAMLGREHAGQRVGDEIELEFNGNAIAHAMNIDPYIVWSGTHFLYPFWGTDYGPSRDTYVDRLLPVSCSP